MKKLVSFKELKTVKTKKNGESNYAKFVPEVKIVCDDFIVESSERSSHEKTMQKVTKVVKDGEKYFDLEEYKNIMLFTFSYELNYFKQQRRMANEN